ATPAQYFLRKSGDAGTSADRSRLGQSPQRSALREALPGKVDDERHILRISLGTQVRDRTRPIHRHRWLLAVADQSAERATRYFAQDCAWHRAAPRRRSRRQAVATPYR